MHEDDTNDKSRPNPKDYNDPELRYDDLDDFFSDSDRMHGSFRKTVITLIFIGFISTTAYIIISVVGIRNNGLSNQTSYILSLLSFVASICASLIASIIVVNLVNRSNTTRIQTIRNLSQQGALSAIFYTLRRYNGRVSHGKRIELHFDKIDTAPNGRNFAHCTLTIHQRIPVLRDHFIVHFIRLGRGEGQSKEVSVSMIGGYAPDDAYSTDTTDILDAYSEISSKELEEKFFKGVVEIAIDSTVISQEKIETLTKGDMTSYTVDISNFDRGRLINVFHRYEFSHEIPGFTYFNVSEPTKGLTCVVDVSRISSYVKLYGNNLLNARTYTHSVNSVSDRYTISTSDWVIPQGAVFFCWYPVP